MSTSLSTPTVSRDGDSNASGAGWRIAVQQRTPPWPYQGCYRASYRTPGGRRTPQSYRTVVVKNCSGRQTPLVCALVDGESTGSGRWSRRALGEELSDVPAQRRTRWGSSSSTVGFRPKRVEPLGCCPYRYQYAGGGASGGPRGSRAL
jgi:hypothetical protein